MPTRSLISIEHIAQVCHEANRAYCRALGDESQPHWDDAPTWQQMSAINGVIFHVNHPDAGPSASHDQWLKEKQETGWQYGETKDVERQLHPCMVPFNELPPEQQRKDALFQAIVHALAFEPTS